MKNFFFSFLIVILISMDGTVALAHDIEVVNDQGQAIYYVFTNNNTELAVSYRGTYENSYEDEYTGDVIIPGTVTYNNTTYPVTSIGNGAFTDCIYLASITIPSSVTSIGNGAFKNCHYLNSLIIPNSVTSIGIDAFSGCMSLTSLIIPNSVTSIGTGAFSFCDRSSIVVEDGNPKYDSRDNCNAIIETETKTLIVGSHNTSIPNSVTSIGDYAFQGCQGGWTLIIPNSVKSIGNGAFEMCSQLTSITIPNSVTTIGDHAFATCGLSSITIPSSVSSIGYNAFGACPELANVTIQEGVTKIGENMFQYCTGLTSIAIPSSVTSIGDYAFQYCSSLTEITIPSSVISIGRGAFDGCTSLTEITIPSSVTSIGDYAFSDCSSLTEITIPSSVTGIGRGAFDGCNRLTLVKADMETPVSIGSNCFSNRTNAILHVPAGCKTAYESADYWCEFKQIIEGPNVINLGNAGYATFCSSQPMDFTGVSGIKVYIISGFNPDTGKLVLTRVTEVPGGEGLYIVGTPGTYNIPSKATAMYYSNLLKGVTNNITLSPTEGNKTNFILANGSHGVAFYTLSKTGTLAAGKAYLQLPSASVAGVKALNIVFEDHDIATGVQEVEKLSDSKVIYNLQGQRISQAKRGFNIINGKKVFIK